MATPEDYKQGTISIDTGTKDLTGTGTAWQMRDFRSGDLLYKGSFVGVIDVVNSDTSITLVDDWAGPTLVNATYRMRYMGDADRTAGWIRDLVDLLGNGNLQSFANLEGTNLTIPMFNGPASLVLVPKTDFVSGVNYNVQVATKADRAAYDAMPGPTGTTPGFTVLVNADEDYEGRSTLYSKLSDASGDWSGAAIITGNQGDEGPMPTVDAGTVTTLDPADPATVDVVPVTGGYAINFGIPKGNKGDQGDEGPPGAGLSIGASGTLAGRDAYDGEAENFVYWDTENGDVYIRQTATPGVWSPPQSYQGPPGADGATITTTNGVGDGTAGPYTLDAAPAGLDNILLATISGVAQYDYSISGNEITFGLAVPVDVPWQVKAAGNLPLQPNTVAGPASAVDQRIAVFDGTSGALLKDGGKTIAELTPVGYDDLLITVSLLALQVADNTNMALFLGEAGNRVADSFDSLAYVDVAGATNLNSSVAGILKPTLTPVDFSFLGATADGTDTATYTFAGQNFGAAASDRFIAVAVETRANSARTISSVTIGGIAATTVVSGNNAAAGAELAAIYIANVPTGTSGDIVVTCSDAMVRCAIGVYRMSNLNSSLATDTDGSTGNTTSGSVSVNVVNGGPVIGVVKQAQTSTWTYLNEDYDEAAPDTAGDYFSFASKLADETKAGQVITNTFGASAVFAMVAASWSPQAGDVDNLTVRSAAFTAAASPTKVKALIRVKEVDAAIAGTDYTLECSRDNGTTWTVMPLTELFTSPSPTANIVVVETSEVDVSGQPSGTQVRWRFKTLTHKMVELHDVYIYWN